MSLEEALDRNSDLLEKHNALLEKVLGAAASKTTAAAAPTAEKTADAGSDEGATETKKTRKPKADKAADAGAGEDTKPAGPTFDDLRKNVAAWLGEFSKAEDKENPAGTHPEVNARKEALKTVFANDKLKIEKLTEISDDAEKIGILNNWLENKAKKIDKGFGIGRFAKDPEPAAASSDDDDDMGL